MAVCATVRAFCNEMVTHWIRSTKRTAVSAETKTKKKNATSQIKCSMFATANATVAFWIYRDACWWLGRWPGAAKLMQSVCKVHGAAPIIIKHNLRFNAFMFGPTEYRMVLPSCGRCVSFNCLHVNIVDVFVFLRFCYAFSLWRFALILFELIWHHMRTPRIMHRRRQSARCTSTSVFDGDSIGQKA